MAPQEADPSGYSSIQNPFRNKKGLGKLRLDRMVLLIAGVPWLTFALVVSVFAFAFEENKALVCFIVVPVMCVSLFVALLGITRSQPLLVAIGFQCLMAMLLATAVGLFVNRELLREYWRLENGAKYYNILPREQARTKQDAAEISFAAGSKVDALRTVGWEHGGTVYCVAPVAGVELEAIVEYWAVGTDCCLERSAFACDDATKPAVRKALVLGKKDGDSAVYRKAIEEAEEVYQVKSGQDALLVRWMQDTVSVRAEVKMDGILAVFCAIAVDSLFSLTIGIAIAHVLKVRQQRRKPFP